MKNSKIHQSVGGDCWEQLSRNNPVNYGAVNTDTRKTSETFELSEPESELRHVYEEHLGLDKMNQSALNRAKKLKYFIGIGFGTVLVSATVALILLLQDDNPDLIQQFDSYGAKQPDDGITFDEFINSEFSYKTFNGSWWDTTELQWKNEEGDLVTWNFLTDETKVLVSHDLLAAFSDSTQFKGFSPDANLLLFASDVSPVWRHSYTAKYIVYDPEKNSSSNVISKDGSEVLQYCSWVENTDSDNTLIYVSNNDLYWRPDASVSDATDDIAITIDGEVDNIFNGIPDWVYEEEVLGSNYANYINEEGNKVAFAHFDDTLVREFRYPFYGDQNNVFESQYPDYKVVKYPKAGETNPILKLFVWKVESPSSLQSVTPPPEVSAWGEYIYTIADWTESDLLSVTWMNRIQNESVISECREDGTSWTCVKVFSQEQKDGWIEIMPPPVYSGSSSNLFIQILPSVQEASGLSYPHIARVDTSVGEDKVFLTQGQMVVTEILAWDQETDLVYFMATEEEGGSIGSRQMYTVPGDGTGSVTCITCQLPTSRGGVCKMNSINMNWDNSYYIHTCRGEGIPESSLRNTSDNSLVYLFEDNKELEEKLQSKSLPDITYTNIDIPGTSFQSPVKILTPPNMSSNTSYPVIVYVYGGPGYQQVSNSWTIGWGEYLATSRNVVYVLMDARGTGFQSNEFLFSVYRNLGTVEMEDQIAVTRKLVSQYQYMDPERIAIWGWSYGGFNTAMTLEKDVEDPVFKCGISVAPVSSWLLYDSIYTERYMALPSDNIDGYNNSLITGIDNLKNKMWMLNHGVADDNVHFQHSMLLVKELEQHDVQFVQHSYPDENHGLRGVSRFLYHAMDNFWSECFETENIPHNSAFHISNNLFSILILTIMTLAA